MYMFQRRKEPRWIVNLKGASLMGIRMVKNVIRFGTQK